MNSYKPERNKKNVIIVSGVIIILLIAIPSLYLFVFKGKVFGWSPIVSSAIPSTNYDKPTSDQINTGNNIKDQSTNNDDPNSVGSDRPTTPVIESGQTKATVPVTISAANQNDGVLQVRTLISAITSSGTCTITLTKDNKVVTRTSEVQSLPSSATCKGFDVPVSDISTGEWQLKVTFENDTIKGENTKAVTVL